MVFELAIARKERNALNPKRLRQYRNPIILAQEWQRRLTNGDSSSPAELAWKLGVSRAHVTQVLRLLKLKSEVLKVLLDIGDPYALPYRERTKA